MFRIATLAGLVLAVLSLTAFAQKDKEKPKAPVYKTPQDAFDAFAAADKKNDYKTVASIMTPQAVKDHAVDLALKMAPLRPDFEDRKDKDLDALRKKFKPAFDIMDKHGLTRKALADVKDSKDKKEMEKARKIVQPLLKDPEAFFVEFLTEFGKIVGAEAKGTQKLTDLKIDGDKAKGTAVTTTSMKDKKDKVKKEPIEFVKIDGSWRIIPALDDATEEKSEKK